jgi:phage antirepressor YoqD-like protein
MLKGIREIAKEFGVGNKTVMAWAKEEGNPIVILVVGKKQSRYRAEFNRLYDWLLKKRQSGGNA